MKKILFLIHDLGQGGAEKVLVNLVNHMDPLKFNITVLAMFGGGINEHSLNKNIRYVTVFKHMIPGNSKLMKLLTPGQLHKWFIKEKYDIEVSYLEGPSARVISGCVDEKTITVSWIHGEMGSVSAASASFRSAEEAERCYQQFDCHVFVAETVKMNFLSLFPQKTQSVVRYNTVESERILKLAAESVSEIVEDDSIKIVAVGTFKEIKGFDRLLRIIKRLLQEEKKVHLYLLGKGPLENEFQRYVADNGLENNVSFLGYHANPYKYVSKCDLFVCSSHREGFSTAATEALIVGTPVCTTLVSGMTEMLGDNCEYGVITENNEEALFNAIKMLVENPKLLRHYKEKAMIRGQKFSTENTVRAVEELFLDLCKDN